MLHSFKQNRQKKDEYCLAAQTKLSALQEDIWGLTRDIHTLHDMLVETQTTCHLLLASLAHTASIEIEQREIKAP